MKQWYKEEFSFIITVLRVGANGRAENCRNGHEIGDSYECRYGCPVSNAGPGGFCSKSMAELFPLLEAVRAGGDLSNLLAKASKYWGEFTCPDGVVTFRLEAARNDQAGQ